MLGYDQLVQKELMGKVLIVIGGALLSYAAYLTAGLLAALLFAGLTVYMLMHKPRSKDGGE